MTPLRILHTEASTEFGGQELRVLEEAKGMKRRGHFIVLALQRESELLAIAKDTGLDVVPVSMGVLNYPYLIKNFGDLISKYQVDIVNTHGSIDSWTASIAGRISNCKPIIIRTRHKFTPISNNARHRILYGRLPHAIITASEAIRQEIVHRNGIDASRIVSIPTGVDLERYMPDGPGEELRKELGIQPGIPIIGTVALLRQEKGLSYFIDAAKLVVQNCPNVKFLIVGSGPEESSLRRKIGEQGLSGQVLLAGFRVDIPRILAEFDVFVLSSLGEGTPQTLTQALAMQRAVVATDVGGVREVLKNGDTGLLVPPRAPHALAEKIEVLLRDGVMRKRLGSNGRTLIIEKYSLETMLDHTEHLYEHLLQERSQRMSLG